MVAQEQFSRCDLAGNADLARTIDSRWLNARGLSLLINALRKGEIEIIRILAQNAQQDICY